MEEQYQMLGDANGLFFKVVDTAWKKADQKVREKALVINKKKTKDLSMYIEQMKHHDM